MKTNIRVLGTVFALALTSSAWAEHEGNVHDDVDGPYHANEFVFESFGSASFGRETIDNISANRIENDARLGVGIGMSYFFIRNFGIGADATIENTQHSFVDNVSTSAIFRIPIGTSGFAPYVYGGGGHEFDLTKQWFAHFGGGMEFRFSHAWGIFTDARYVLVDKTANYGVARLGFRASF